MTSPQPPHLPPVMPGTPQSPAAPYPSSGLPAYAQPEKSRVLPALLGVLMIVFIGVAGVLAAIAFGLGPDRAPAASTAEPASGNLAAPAEPVTATTTAGNRPYPSNFELTPKITDKQCFGSAGCNVELEVKVGYDGAPLSEDDTWQVTYEITGDDSGPIIGSFDISGETYDVNTESLSTRSSKTKISVKVTDVEKRGL